jgi:GMP synthase (glutamine-hydrolysing)
MSTTRRAIVLQHVPFEGPARLADLFSERGFSIEVRRLDQGDDVPERIEPADVLVVMGGPMGISDMDRPEFAFLQRELQLLARCVEDTAPVLGVCLGAQLLAFAAGAPVVPMVDARGEREFELGWEPIALHSTGAADSILSGLPTQAWVLHWHGDKFGLPAGARRLASTARCENQAFQLNERLFGLQFHCEVAPEHVDTFLRADAAFVARALGPHGDALVRAQTAEHAAPAWQVGSALLQNIIDAMLR